jgi:hypothetical protein
MFSLLPELEAKFIKNSALDYGLEIGFQSNQRYSNIRSSLEVKSKDLLTANFNSIKLRQALSPNLRRQAVS